MWFPLTDCRFRIIPSEFQSYTVCWLTTFRCLHWLMISIRSRIPWSSVNGLERLRWKHRLFQTAAISSLFRQIQSTRLIHFWFLSLWNTIKKNIFRHILPAILPFDFVAFYACTVCFHRALSSNYPMIPSSHRKCSQMFAVCSLFVYLLVHHFYVYLFDFYFRQLCVLLLKHNYN